MISKALLNIANEYFQSIFLTDEQKNSIQEKPSPDDGQTLSEATQEKVLFTTILPHSKGLEHNILQDYEATLSQTGIHDLHLLVGSKNSPQKSILNEINHTQTRTGKCVKGTMLACPTHQLSTIKQRQQTIQQFQKKEIAGRIDQILTQYKEAEPSIVSFYREEDPLKHPGYKKNLNSFYFKWFGLARLNTSSIALQLGKLWKDYWLHLGFGFFFSFGIVYNLITRGWAPVGIERVSSTVIWTKLSLSEICYSVFSLCFFNDMVLPGMGLYNNFSSWQEKWAASLSLKFFLLENISRLFFTLIFLLMGIFFVYHAIKKYQRNKQTLYYLAERLLAFQAFIQAIEELSLYAQDHQELQAMDKAQLAHIHHLLHASKKTSLGKLVHNLKTLPLKEWNYFFRPQGKLLATYQLLEANKYALADAIYTLGQIDALRSVAIHLEKAAAYSADQHYTFTKFIEQSEVPVIEQKHIWHPSLDARNAVPNDVIMGGQEGGLRTMILTGPNAGGKSTYLHVITVNLVLGQVFGIAAGQDSQQTVFHRIVTYFDIIQDLSAGLSFFEAKVKGLKDLSKALSECPKGQFIFCMLDEPLSGTAEDVASKAGYSIVENFHTKCPQALFIIVTHLAKLTELDKNKGCENRKVYVEREGKAFRYTYKIMPGKSDQNIALEILEKEGLIDTPSS